MLGGLRLLYLPHLLASWSASPPLAACEKPNAED